MLDEVRVASLRNFSRNDFYLAISSRNQKNLGKQETADAVAKCELVVKIRLLENLLDFTKWHDQNLKWG